MKFNLLGKSEISVSEIALGCMSLKPENLKENIHLIHQAIDNGINFLDTADLYDFGENEILIGRAIKGKRDEVIISSKVGNQWKSDKSGWTWNVSSDYIHSAIDQSLQRLQVDYIDLYQIHGGTKEDNFEEVVETCNKLIKQGKIRAYGISSIRPNVFQRFAKESSISSIMMQCSLLDTRPLPYLEFLKKNGISVLARGAFAQGALLGKETNAYLTHSPQDIKDITKLVDDLANEFQVSKEAITLAYLLKYLQITAAVIGLRTQKQLDNLLKAHKELQNISINFNEVRFRKIDYSAHLD